MHGAIGIYPRLARRGNQRTLQPAKTDGGRRRSVAIDSFVVVVRVVRVAEIERRVASDVVVSRHTEIHVRKHAHPGIAKRLVALVDNLIRVEGRIPDVAGDVESIGRCSHFDRHRMQRVGLRERNDSVRMHDPVRHLVTNECGPVSRAEVVVPGPAVSVYDRCTLLDGPLGKVRGRFFAGVVSVDIGAADDINTIERGAIRRRVSRSIQRTRPEVESPFCRRRLGQRVADHAGYP